MEGRVAYPCVPLASIQVLQNLLFVTQTQLPGLKMATIVGLKTIVVIQIVKALTSAHMTGYGLAGKMTGNVLDTTEHGVMLHPLV